MFAKQEHKTTNENVLSGSINLIGAGTVINGDLSCKGDIRIDGEIKGNVSSLAKVVIGNTGKVTGDINGSNADISGELLGDIKVNDTIFLKSSGRIQGNIETNKLIVESGAVFTGHCKMGLSSQKPLSSYAKTEHTIQALAAGN